LIGARGRTPRPGVDCGWGWGAVKNYPCSIRHYQPAFL
jgi:hypothetical protein